MTSAARSQARARVLRLLSLERGVLLWLPAVVGAALFLLWAMRVAPSESAHYTEARELLLILGPLHSIDDMPRARDTLRAALRDQLERQRDFALVPEGAVQRRTQALQRRNDVDALEWIRATRNLKARFYLTGEIEQLAQGGMQVRLDIWETASERPIEALTLRGASTGVLARQLADSLCVVLFEPALQRNAQR